MNSRKINRKIISFLQTICDEDTFFMKKKAGHPVCVAEYGGQKRIFTLSSSPNRDYPNYMKPAVNRFVRTLSIENKPLFPF